MEEVVRDDSSARERLDEFLKGNGPVKPVCTFGILAAKRDLIQYHVLPENTDLRLQAMMDGLLPFLEEGPQGVEDPSKSNALIFIDPRPPLEVPDLTIHKRRLHRDLYTAMLIVCKQAETIEMARLKMRQIFQINTPSAFGLPEYPTTDFYRRAVLSLAMGPEYPEQHPRYAPEACAVITWTIDAAKASDRTPAAREAVLRSMDARLGTPYPERLPFSM